MTRRDCCRRCLSCVCRLALTYRRVCAILITSTAGAAASILVESSIASDPRSGWTPTTRNTRDDLEVRHGVYSGDSRVVASSNSIARSSAGVT